MRLNRLPEAIRFERLVRALVARYPRPGTVPRQSRRDGRQGFGGQRDSRERDLPRAAGRAKHGAVTARLTIGKAQTEHRNSPFSSGPNVAIKPVAGGNPV
jgi:hypothetical protein